MPIGSSIGSSATTGAPQKADQIKQIGTICLPSNSSLEMSNSSTTLATNRVTNNTSNANFYTNSNQGPMGAVGAMSVMVARFDSNSRQQTVILHPRPISSGNRPAFQMSAAIRGQTVISGQTLSTTGSTPSLTSSSASISVRTHLIGGQQHASNAVPLSLNLQSNANTSGVSSHSASAVKQICGPNRPFITTSGSLPIESLSLVVANPNDTNVVNARPIRLQTNDLKSNTIHSINKMNPRTVSLGSTLMATSQPTKMAISIGGSGAQTTTAMGTHVARVGFLGPQITMGSGANTASNKPPIINLVQNKGQIIINSATAQSLNAGNTGLHNMVNVSGSVASFPTSAQSSQTTKLSVNSSVNNNTLTNRHSIVSTTPFIQQNVSNISQQHSQSSSRPTVHQNVHQNANINSSQTPSTIQSQQSLQPTTTASTASPLRPTILSSPVNSPVKQSQLQTSTPSSPRPSILIRKRIANDSHTGLPHTTLFKTKAPNTTITGPTTPIRPLNFGLKTTEASLGPINADNIKVNDISTIDPIGVNCGPTVPTTPNSEGNQTPRKKPRKQLLEPSSLKTSQNIHLLNNSANTSKEREVINDKESVVRINKKPRVSLLSSYNVGWKSLQYHFLRYSDVRPKPEKKLTLSELSNEGIQRKNGWKIHHLATQMEVMSDNEESVYRRLNQFLDTFEKDVSALSNQCSTTNTNISTNITNNLSLSELNVNSRTVDSTVNNLDSIAVKLNDLIRGNLQRSNLFADQISEARQLIIKLTNDHKERVGKITKKCANKRTYITK